ncbi:flagellar hook-associated protein FlgL [Effusibacillus consociatus]|uniref:flagellar hook-associated protein FlgL n=1 Tax=Effusibacillus consociatus TaxID=1117041 RepID=UPI0036D2725D
MRVTQSMLSNQMLRNLRSNNERMQNYQEMMSTGKRINSPSDDPVGVSFAMRYEAKLERNEQYKRNLDVARSLLDASDSAISKVNTIFQRARELAVQGANDPVPPEAKANIAAEIEQLYSELVNVANTRFNGKSIFNGQMTDQDPYTEANAQNESADTHDIVIAAADGANIVVNISGQSVFGKPVGQESDNAFAVLQDLKNSLLANDSQTTSATIGRIDSRLDKIHRAWADVGARSNRVDLVRNRVEEASISLTKLSSDTIDADMAEVITNFKMQENVYRASLGTGARVIQPSLVDFLR